MGAQERLDDLHHQMAMEVKALLGDSAMAITVISISEKPTGQMVLCDVERHPKSDTAARLRVAAHCLMAAPSPQETAEWPPKPWINSIWKARTSRELEMAKALTEIAGSNPNHFTDPVEHANWCIERAAAHVGGTSND